MWKRQQARGSTFLELKELAFQSESSGNRAAQQQHAAVLSELEVGRCHPGLLDGKDISIAGVQLVTFGDIMLLGPLFQAWIP